MRKHNSDIDYKIDTLCLYYNSANGETLPLATEIPPERNCSVHCK